MVSKNEARALRVNVGPAWSGRVFGKSPSRLCPTLASGGLVGGNGINSWARSAD